MFKPSATIHRSSKGEVKVIVCSEDAGKCLDAYRTCTDPGTVVYIRKGHLDKSKNVESKAQLEAKAKAVEDAAKARLKVQLEEASAKAEASAKVAAEAKANLETLSPKKSKKVTTV